MNEWPLKGAEQKRNESILSSKLQSKIKIIEEQIFPGESLEVRIDKDTESDAEASHHFDENDPNNTEGRFYTVWEKGIKNKLDGSDNSEKEVLRIALHEVRHRVQHDLGVRMINISDINQFIIENPKSAIEVYFSSPEYRKFIDYASGKSANDFDAMVVEDIAMKLFRGDYSDENIKKITTEIIKQSADDIVDYLRKV